MRDGDNAVAGLDLFAFLGRAAGSQRNDGAIAVGGGEQRANEFVARRTEAWLSAAERVLRENKSTMAVVPMAELFAPDGYLAGLRARGYKVVEPI